MTTTIYLTGHRTFANRGCEAIVRSTVRLLREHDQDLIIQVPSTHPELDAAQWPQHAQQGVELVPAWLPPQLRYWIRLQRLPLSLLKRIAWPFPFSRATRRRIRGADGILAVGGDNYTLDYHLPSPYVGIDGFALRLHRPVVLWGASVGPFEREPAFRPVVREHLARLTHIRAREPASERYLRTELGLENVSRMPDPAFYLEPEPCPLGSFWPHPAPCGVLGLNVSGLLQRYTDLGFADPQQIVDFVRFAVQQRGLGVLLIPHVIPHEGVARNNDAWLAERLHSDLRDLGGAVQRAPALNAAQLKHVIGHCRCFIGARSHATIAALSSGVPTLSVAYSVKARGINQDLFGHEHWVVATELATPERLGRSLDTLLEQAPAVRQQLLERLMSVEAALREAARQTLLEITH